MNTVTKVALLNAQLEKARSMAEDFRQLADYTHSSNPDFWLLMAPLNDKFEDKCLRIHYKDIDSSLWNCAGAFFVKCAEHYTAVAIELQIEIAATAKWQPVIDDLVISVSTGCRGRILSGGVNSDLYHVHWTHRGNGDVLDLRSFEYLEYLKPETV